MVKLPFKNLVEKCDSAREVTGNGFPKICNIATTILFIIAGASVRLWFKDFKQEALLPQCDVSVKILPTAAPQCRNKLYN